MKKMILLMVAFSWVTSALAQGPHPRTGILPENPIEGDNIIVGVAGSLSPCLAIDFNDPTFYHLSDSNHITFVFVALVANPCPDVPGFSLQYEIGTLATGDYTIQVYIVNSSNELPTSINDPIGVPGGVGAPWGDLVSFNVRGNNPPAPVPTLHFMCLLLMAGFIVIAVYRIGFNKVLMASIVLMFSTNVLSNNQAGFELPVIIDPPNPTSNHVIQIGLFHTFHFPCLILPQQNLDGETHLFIHDNPIPGYPQNHIDLIAVGLDSPFCSPFPVTPAPREYYELGTLPAGEYSLRTGIIGPVTQFPLPPNEVPFQYGEILRFTVSEPPEPMKVSATSNFALSILLVLVSLFTFRFINRS